MRRRSRSPESARAERRLGCRETGSGGGGMTKVAVLEENDGAHQVSFRAVTAGNQAMGRTAGEALDALTSQLPDGGADTLIIVRSLRPDHLFTARSGNDSDN